jgi:ElaB/YqjD/DUF883 family membrane-anchored ribosome-binding protein
MPTGSTVFLVFTGVVTFAVVLQTVILLAVVFAAKGIQSKALEQIERLREDLRPFLDATTNVMETFEDIAPKLRATAANIHTTSDRLREQVDHIDSVVRDVTGKARHQVNRADHMVTDTLDAVAHGIRVIQDNVMAPLRQIGGWMSAIRAGMDLLRPGGDRRSRKSHIRSDEDFI